MPAPQMNEAWWVANKAKTLTDAGDTVKGALAAWDKIKKNPSRDTDFPKVLEVLHTLAGKAAALKGKANSVLHKETIGYLDYYFKTCADISTKLRNATGDEIAKNMTNLPKAVAEALKAVDPKWWAWHGDSIGFLAETKSGKGNKKIYDTYGSKSSPKSVNLPSALQAKVDAAAKAGKWDDPAWKEARAEVTKMIEKDWKGDARKQIFGKIAKVNVLDACKAR